MLATILSIAAGASLPRRASTTLLLRPSSLATVAFATTTTTTTTSPTTRRRRLLRRRAVNPEAPMAGTVKLYDRHVRLDLSFLVLFGFIPFLNAHAPHHFSDYIGLCAGPSPRPRTMADALGRVFLLAHCRLHESTKSLDDGGGRGGRNRGEDVYSQIYNRRGHWPSFGCAR